MAEGRNRTEAPRSRTSATETLRRERRRTEERHSAEERDALLRDHSFCEICGHRFYDPRLAEFESPLWSASINNDPLQREEDYLVHFMAEHMLDELNAGRITDDDVNDLANYLDVSKANRRKLVLGLSASDAEGDPLLRQSFRHHSQLRRIDNCFAAFLTLFLVWVVYQAQFGAETNVLGKMARKASRSVMGAIGQGMEQAAGLVIDGESSSRGGVGRGGGREAGGL
jgi:hypothetical protein